MTHVPVDDPDGGIPLPGDPAEAHPIPLLVFVALIGGAAPFLVRIASQLATAGLDGKEAAIPALGVWMGVGIFAVLGLATSVATADRNARQYFIAAMMAPALIANVSIGVQAGQKTRSAAEPEAASRADPTGLFASTAFAQAAIAPAAATDPDRPSSAPTGAGTEIQVMIDVRNAAAISGGGDLNIQAAGAEGANVQAACPIVSGTNCSIWVPSDTELVTLNAAGRSAEIRLEPDTKAIGVAIETAPTVTQQFYWALGGTLRGNVSGLTAEAFSSAAR
ncbi:hypothetical protein ACUN0C_07655 [Faunimonas sp. B44]|uniref:hypothetical protein n=1 Tax=Faunimonas sp. B44 TaxID=3461493 RepID=UPI004044EBBD